MVIVDNFLVGCSQYVHSNGGHNVNEFISTLIKCVPQCPTNEDDLQSYFYFKQLLLHSNM